MQKNFLQRSPQSANEKKPTLVSRAKMHGSDCEPQFTRTHSAELILNSSDENSFIIFIILKSFQQLVCRHTHTLIKLERTAIGFNLKLSSFGIAGKSGGQDRQGSSGALLQQLHRDLQCRFRVDNSPTRTERKKHTVQVNLFKQKE